MIQIAEPDVGMEEQDRITEVLDSGMLADGPPVREFEETFAAFCGTAHAVATSNGTTALHAGLEAIGIGEGDLVLTSPFSFVASANAIRLVGAEPVFADIDPETYTLDPAAAREKLRQHEGDIDAILVVHLYGLPADMDEFVEITENHDLALIEDAAQAHGAAVDGERVGSIGDIGCFSFYPTKNMTTGEGGMVVTDDPDIADRAARFINHGRTGDGKHAEVGHNFRMTSVAGAIGLAQLEKLPSNTETRRRNASMLTEGLADSSVTTPVEPPRRHHVYHQYTVRYEDREQLQETLDEHDIGYGVYYPRPIHKEQAYADVDVSTPAAERAAQEVLSLPVHPGVSKSDIGHILEVFDNV